jgi:hypothetical protein
MGSEIIKYLKLKAPIPSVTRNGFAVDADAS